MIVSISTGISTTVKSAQSKKCRMLAKVRAGTMHAKVAMAILTVDPMLAGVCTNADIEAAKDGTRPSRGGGKSGIKLTVELD